MLVNEKTTKYFKYHKFIFIINKNVYIYQKNNFKKLKEFFFIKNYRINKNIINSKFFHISFWYISKLTIYFSRRASHNQRWKSILGPFTISITSKNMNFIFSNYYPSSCSVFNCILSFSFFTTNSTNSSR